MFWSPRDTYPYDEAYYRPDGGERLRHLVFLDGRLIDTWTEHVETTAYQSMAAEFDREKQVHYVSPEPLRPPYERVLRWLDGEFLAATCTALADVRRGDPDLLLQASAGEIAATLSWAVGRANGLVGAGTPVSQKDIKATLWLSTPPTRRLTRVKACLRGLQAEPTSRPQECPDLLELGTASHLTSPTRRRLIILRDRALAASEQAEADQQAREALRPNGIANLTS
jgi:hypothetical protein